MTNPPRAPRSDTGPAGAANFCRAAWFGTLTAMLAAEIWYWWIGVILTGVGVLSVIALIAGYLKNVTALKYPGRKQEDD